MGLIKGDLKLYGDCQSVTVALVSEGLGEVLVRGGLERDRPGSTEAEKMRATEVTVIRR